MDNHLTHHQLEHGGQLRQIAKQYNIPLEDWLDLSTGISPIAYPVPQIPSHVWQNLPEQQHPQLLETAKQYYACQHLLAVSGSQAIIQLLPKMVALKTQLHRQVWLPDVGYQEHKKAWNTHHYTVKTYKNIEQLKQLAKGDVVVLINPNNPSGVTYSHSQITTLSNKIRQQHGLLIIDEAFMDCTPSHSFIKQTEAKDVIVLRSVGKFFGLAGIRLGFVAAHPEWLEQFASALGPWAVNAPAQFIGQKALSDSQWQQQQRATLKALSKQLTQLLKRHFAKEPTGTCLFQTVQHHSAPQIFDDLCKQGVYVRLCDEKNALRFGIPLPQQVARLEQALSMCSL